MLESIVLAIGLVVAAPVPEEPEPVALFAAEDWYKNQAGKEQEFTGILIELRREGRAGFGRYNAYRLILEGDKREMREVYVGSKPDLLRDEIGLTPERIAESVAAALEHRVLRSA